MKEYKIISFDLDGTLTDSSFANSVWLNEIPILFADKHKVSIKKAKKIVSENYNRIGNEKIEWYDISFWIKKFNLDINPLEFLNSHKEKIKLFNDILLTLKKLSGQKKIIISNARREFVDLEIAQTGIGNFFDHIFSATSDFNLIKSDHTTFLEVCRICKILPSEMLHIGDDYKFDFKVPRELGIKAIFLDRNGKKKREDTVQSLNQIVIK